MLSSGAIVSGYRYGTDGYCDADMGHCTKKRNSETSEHPTNMVFEYLQPKSPLVVSSPSGSSPSIVHQIDVVAGEETILPRQISIMNIVRPIPNRISTQYYDEAHRKGLTFNETSQAAIIAQDWHRKWTYQDEENHTMPEKDFYASTTSGIPHSYAYDKIDCDSNSDVSASNDFQIFLEREEGAKNPSLGSSPEKTRRTTYSRPVDSAQKRQYSTTNDRPREHANNGLKQLQFDFSDKRTFKASSADSSTTKDSGSEEDLSNHQVKRQFTGFDSNAVQIEDDEDDQYTYESYHEDDDSDEFHNKSSLSKIQRPLPIRPITIKPVALHVFPPGFGFPQPTDERLSPFMQNGKYGKIPRDITTNIFRGEQIVSPMSHSQVTSSSTSLPRRPSDHEMIGMTVLKTNRDGLHLVEDNGEPSPVAKGHDMDSISTTAHSVVKERDAILHTLAIRDGDVESDDFKTKVEPLEKYFMGNEVDTRQISETSVSNLIEGMWLTLSKPNWFGKLGQNDNGDPMYTLGRMSFDMFSPTNLVCSLQGNFNRVEVVNGEDRKAMLDLVPKKLREEVESGSTVLRTYHIVTAFTIEPSMAAFPNAPNKDVIRPIRGIMTTYGYSLPDPDTPNRHSIWFTGGRVEPNNDVSDTKLWKNFFKLHPPKHSFGEKAKLLAVKLLMGATIPQEIDPHDGSMNYVFTRPLGGHNIAYVDVVYLDESLRIVRGQRGTTFVFLRVPDA